MSNMSLGGGGRWDKCIASARASGAKSPEGVCYARGKKKYGAKGMAALASKGTGGAKTALAGMKKGKKS